MWNARSQVIVSRAGVSGPYGDAPIVLATVARLKRNERFVRRREEILPPVLTDPETPLYFGGSARLGSARLGSARLGSARLGSARLGSALRALAEKFFTESLTVSLISVYFTGSATQNLLPAKQQDFSGSGVDGDEIRVTILGLLRRNAWKLEARQFLKN
ncbi:MAG: hypothetical protein KGY53_07575 [Wenzhouxiangellaceae bacterium]|nr:hypothetical protein [Wenzhouxiangellaceae bacterium]